MDQEFNVFTEQEYKKYIARETRGCSLGCLGLVITVFLIAFICFHAWDIWRFLERLLK